MAGLAGLTGLNTPGPGAGQYMDEGVLEAHGLIDGVAAEHSDPGDRSGQTWPAGYGAGYKASQYGPSVNQGHTPCYDEAGYPYDRTPDVHASPYPEGLIQPDLETPGSYATTASQLAVQRKKLHGRDMGGPRKFNRNDPAGREVQAHYTTDRYDAPNTNDLSSQVPGQIKGTGSALRDTTQGYGQLNSLDEFQRGHSIRRVQHDTMHFDHSLSDPTPQVFRGRHKVMSGNQFTEDSPYGPVYGDTSTGQQVVWEGRMGYPTTYAAPAEPVIIPPVSSGPDVWAY